VQSSQSQASVSQQQNTQFWDHVDAVEHAASNDIFLKAMAAPAALGIGAAVLAPAATVVGTAVLGLLPESVAPSVGAGLQAIGAGFSAASLYKGVTQRDYGALLGGVAGAAGLLELGLGGAVSTAYNPSPWLDTAEARFVPDTAATSGPTITPRLDVSDEFTATPLKSGSTLYQYLNPSPDDLAHGLWANVSSDGQLSFTVRASGDSTTLGSGQDMFDSLMLRLSNDKVSVTSIAGEWHIGSDSVNAVQYQSALSSGLTPSEAAYTTWTGNQAMRYGFNQVTVPPIEGNVIRPIFQQGPGSN
jgi:hypothetical protein